MGSCITAFHSEELLLVTPLWNVDYNSENPQNAVHISLYSRMSYQFHNNAILIWTDDTCTVSDVMPSK